MLTCYTSAQAKIIELDSAHGIACRLQLRTQQNEDQTPLVLIYDKAYEPEEQLVKNYEKVALTHPEWAFFKFDLDKATPSSFQQCLGLVPDKFVFGAVIEKVARVQYQGMTYITNPFAAISGIELTEEEIKKFTETATYKKSPRFQFHTR